MRLPRSLRHLRLLAALLLIQPALALQRVDETQELADASGTESFDVSRGVRLSIEPSSLSAASLGSRPTVFTSMYWSRAYEQRAEAQERYGLHWAYGFSLDQYSNTALPYTGHSPLGYSENLHWSAKPMAGLQFERHNLFFQGDHLNIRATSDMQALFRETGLFRSTEEVDALSLLGWRSHSTLSWELGEPTREIQWQFSARFDRRAYSQSNTANFSLLRRF